MRCDWCAAVGADSFVVFEGQGDGAMTLCGRCCDIAFPGMRDVMHDDCPICREAGSGFEGIWN